MQLNDVLKVISSSRGSLEFLKTGFPGIDNDLDGGFLRGEMVVIGGFTGLGKSYLAGQIMLNIAKQGFSIAYYSLEISNQTIVSRLIGSLSNIKPIRIQTGWLTLEENQRKQEAIAELECFEKYFSFYDNLYSLTEIEKNLKETKPEFAVIDFIQNIFSPGEEYERLSFISLRLQKLAKEINGCFLVLSQLSNEAAKNPNPAVLEYKGSGSIAQICDLGFRMNQKDFNQIELILGKNRRGVSRRIFYLNFEDPGGRIYESQT